MIFDIAGTATDLAVNSLVIAGWTGREKAQVQKHIDELAEIGITPPSATPLFYRVSRGLLVQADEIEVLGPDTSGEAEPVLTCHDGRMLIGLGSDHTDRALETSSVAHSKQVCPKPVAAQLWPLPDPADTEALEITTEIHEGGNWRPYQSGRIGALLPLAGLWRDAGLGDGDWMLCGTFAAIGGIRPATRYRMRLSDPATGRDIALDYRTRILPVVR